MKRVYLVVIGFSWLLVSLGMAVIQFLASSAGERYSSYQEQGLYGTTLRKIAGARLLKVVDHVWQNPLNAPRNVVLRALSVLGKGETATRVWDGSDISPWPHTIGPLIIAMIIGSTLLWTILTFSAVALVQWAAQRRGGVRRSSS